MSRSEPGVVVTVALILAVFTPGAFPEARPGEPATWIAGADTVVAVEILRTDYTAAAADGPMYAEARILAVVKGEGIPGGMLRFGETAWCGPTYKAGELRILFLKRVTSGEYFRSASWATPCPRAARIDAFFDREALARLAPSSLQAFLEEVQAVRSTPPRLRAEVARREGATVTLAITLVNDGPQPLWVNPSMVSVSFDAGTVRHVREVSFAGVAASGWIAIAPAQGLRGTLSIARNTLQGTDRIVLRVSHTSVYYPKRSWAGTLASTPVQVGS